MKYALGIDIGGTNISAAIVSNEYDIISKSRIKTRADRTASEIITDIKALAKQTISASGIDKNVISWIGIGCPGTCNTESGIVEYSNNLRWRNVELRAEIKNTIGIPVFLDNDANAAAFGEFLAGAATNSRNAVVITLGTGLGAGIIIDGRIYSGSNYAGGEIGHTVIVFDGAQCTCGRNGCFEAYSSATALVRITKETMVKYPDSKLYDFTEQGGRVTGRTAFNAAKAGDLAGQMVVDLYIKYLACGIANVINIFQPDILCIGGGVCNEGENLMNPLKSFVKSMVYTKNSDKNTEIALCKLGSDAGIIGAAMLGKK